jgi:hypothetical protein
MCEYTERISWKQIWTGLIINKWVILSEIQSSKPVVKTSHIASACEGVGN